MEILNTIPGSVDGWGIFLGIFVGIFALTKVSLEKSPDQYEAVVTDFNEVYHNGYEIVEQRGDIYILTKSEAK